jgi:hypothetical protein
MNNIKQKTFKTLLVDLFLKYQFSICVDSVIPLSHALPLVLLTCIFDSLYYISIYWVSIIYILTTVYLAETFPNSFGARYIAFLKRHSSIEIFNKYCGNPWSALKTAIQNPEFIKIAAKNGVGKGIKATGLGLAGEHLIHKSKVGQVYEYQVEKSLNNGKHPSGKPFFFKPNGPSILEKCVGRK